MLLVFKSLGKPCNSERSVMFASSSLDNNRRVKFSECFFVLLDLTSLLTSSAGFCVHRASWFETVCMGVSYFLISDNKQSVELGYVYVMVTDISGGFSVFLSSES